MSFSSRLDHAVRSTGLTPAQLGVARVFQQPVPPTNTDPGLPLSGLEVLVKDLHQVAGQVVSCGSIHQQFTPAHHDSSVKWLLNNGATLVGASATSEFGTTAYTEPVGYQAPINPLGDQFMCGGSSGGAAVAVAHGLVDVAHATDGGGSIRIPAACCGLVGLKPAHNHTAVAAQGFTPTAQGFIAKDFDHTRRAYGLQAGALRRRERAKHHANAHHAADLNACTAPLRLGYTNTPFHSKSHVDPAIAAATAAVASLLVTHPAVASVGHAPQPYERARFQAFGDFLSLRCADLPGQLSPLTDWLRQRGRQIPPHHHPHLVEQIVNLNPLQRWDELDVVITPMLACAPPPPGTFSSLAPQVNFMAQTAWTPWATLWNLTGWASVTVPLVDPKHVQGRWPIALMLGAVSDRVTAAELVDLAQFAQQVAGQLPAEQLSMSDAGDVHALEFEPKPPQGEHCDHGDHCDNGKHS